MSHIDEISTNLRAALLGRYEPADIKEIEDIVCVCLADYDITPKETHLVVFDDGDGELMRRYFLAKAVQGCTRNTAETYNTILSAFLRDSQRHFKDVSTDDVRLYLARKKIQKASDSYLATIHRTLSSFYGWCASEGLIEKNPMPRVEKIKVRKKEETALTDEQMETLRYAARTKRERALIEFLYSTGCRISEAVNLNITDINFESGEVSVLGKGRKWRVVYLTQRAKFALQDYLKERTDKSEALFGYDYSACPEHLMGEGNIVLNKTGLDGRLTKDNAEQILRKLGRRCNIKLHPHLLRKTVATIALTKGMPIDQVRQMLGHESIATTTIYAQTKQADVKAAHEKYV